MEKFTGKEGLTSEELLELLDSYDNPCIEFLSAMCNVPFNNQYPKRCLPASSIFSRSIRKDVCPAISLAPSVLWFEIFKYISEQLYIHFQGL